MDKKVYLVCLVSPIIAANSALLTKETGKTIKTEETTFLPITCLLNIDIAEQT